MPLNRIFEATQPIVHDRRLLSVMSLTSHPGAHGNVFVHRRIGEAMTVIRIFNKRSRAVLLVGAIAATGGVVAASATPASAAAVSTRASASTPACTGATTYAGKAMPGYRGTRTPCFITYGSSGNQVKALQRFLNTSAMAGASVAVDGSYGPATKRKVQAYQRAWNVYPCGNSRAIRNTQLAVDGAWGPRTSKVSQNQLEYCGD